MSLSDSDEYINIDSMIDEINKNIYQIQLNKEQVFIKKIGVGSSAPDIIIIENFGSKNEFSLYNCVYLEDEIFSIGNNTCFYPIIKLIDKSDNKILISSIVIKFTENIFVEKLITNFDLYYVKNIDSEDYVQVLDIQKDVFSENIVEKIIYYMNQNIMS